MFPQTRWTLIRQAAECSTDTSRRALSELCQQYAGPVLGYVKRRLASNEEAEDATQDFFAWLIDGSLLERADESKGRFRSLLLHSLKGFLADRHDHATAQKRGGQVRHVCLEIDQVVSEGSRLSPEAQFEYEWIRTILRTAIEELRQEYSENGRQELFDVLVSSLDGSTQSRSQTEACQQLRMSPAALRVALHRMKKKLGLIIRGHIRDTVDSAGDVESEITNLMSALDTNR